MERHLANQVKPISEKQDRERIELYNMVNEFDIAVEKGILPTVKEFMQVCRLRARYVRLNSISFGNWGKKDLLETAKRLEKIAEGDNEGLYAEALARAKAFRDLRKDTPTKDSKEAEELALAEKTWMELAKLVKKSK